jgi:hypothetical protein
MRKIPAVAFVARYYCPEQRTTFGLLPDFYVSQNLEAMHRDFVEQHKLAA